ncbi:radical SAM protein [Patescibacteria group bacterium]|nr:radical SAM protein [Patescibacteria group bacterium]
MGIQSWLGWVQEGEFVEEITIELTDYCPHRCMFCSSNTVDDELVAVWVSMDIVRRVLGDRYFDRIILSGGEPLAHPEFYAILQECRKHTVDVVVYTNALTHIAYNAHVIDSLYVEATVTVLDSVNKLRLLKRVVQGRERTRPEVSFSRNFTEDCQCSNSVVRPDGTISPTPCRKECIQ